VDLGGYDPDVIQRRIDARIRAAGLTEPSAYLDLLESDPAEPDRLLDEIAVNVSWFFRDSLVFGTIAETILPALIAHAAESGRREMRIWSAGCAAGQEAWSLAILAVDALRRARADLVPLVFGTDIDGAALERAHAAVYPRSDFESTTLGILDKHFTRVEGGYEVDPLLREVVHFARDDLTSSATLAPPESIYGAFDLVLCRNVVIYFGRELRRRVHRKLCRSLDPGGYLVLGNSEFIEPDARLDVVTLDVGTRVYHRGAAPRTRGEGG